MISEKFVWLAAIIELIGGLSYVIATLRGKTRPNRVSWFLWFLAPMIAFASQLHQGVYAQALLTFMAGFNPLLVLIATFISHKSQWKITRLDVICGSLSVMGLAFWLLADAPNVAIFFSIFADAMAGVPTIIKSYKEPETEHGLVFLGGAIASVITLLTIQGWKFQNAAFSVYILIICVILFSLIEVRPFLKSQFALKDK